MAGWASESVRQGTDHPRVIWVLPQWKEGGGQDRLPEVTGSAPRSEASHDWRWQHFQEGTSCHILSMPVFFLLPTAAPACSGSLACPTEVSSPYPTF